MSDHDEEAGVRKSSRARRAVDRYDDAAQKNRTRQVTRKSGRVAKKGKRKRQEENRANKKTKRSGKSEKGKKDKSVAPRSSFVTTFFNFLSQAQSSLAGEFELPRKWIDEICKVPPYRHLKQNLYRAPLCRPVFDEEVDATVCNCIAQGGQCDENCVNRQLFLECVPGHCPCLTGRFNERHKPLCKNTAISSQSFPNIKVISTPGRGYGLFVCEDVPANTIVAEYMGEVITTEETAARMASYSGSDHFYFANLGRGLMLDASKMGSLARFANHSCEPNCAMQRWTVLGEPRIVLTALVDIPANSEVTYCYNFEDDGWAHNPIRAQVCLCGSRFCSGRVGKAATGSQGQIEKLTSKMHEHISGHKRASLDALVALLAQAKAVDDRAITPTLRTATHALEALVHEAQTWSQRCRDLLESPSLVEVCALEAMLADLPAGLRAEPCKELRRCLAAYHAAVEGLSSLVGQAAVGWEAAVQGLRQVQAALPVRVPGTLDLLHKYVCLLDWCAAEVWPLAASMKAVSDKLSPTPATAHPTRSAGLHAVAQRLAPWYGLAPATLSADYPTAIAALLDERLTLYMQAQTAPSSSSCAPRLCFCQLPEEGGDCPLAVQCVLCTEWFHVDCINLPAWAAVSVQHQDGFHCPVCLLGRGLLSHLALGPETEWSARRLACVLRTGPVGEEEEGGRRPSGKGAPPRPTRWKHFVTAEDVDGLVQTSRGLAVQGSPVAALLGLAQTFLAAWTDDVQRWETQRLPSLAAFLSAARAEDWEQSAGLEAAAWLRDVLRLYWRLAVLRIQPGAVLSRLRLAIWTLAALPAAVDGLPPRCPGEGGRGVDRRLSAAELRAVATAGEALHRAATARRLPGGGSAGRGRAMDGGEAAGPATGRRGLAAASLGGAGRGGSGRAAGRGGRGPPPPASAGGLCRPLHD